MEFWSKGLGRRPIVLALGGEKVECDGERVQLAGQVRSPVTWRYIIYLGPEDWLDFFELALRPPLATYLLQRRQLGVLARLAAFLLQFTCLYALALVRKSLGLARLDGRVSAEPDLSAKSQIDPSALETGSAGSDRLLQERGSSISPV